MLCFNIRDYCLLLALISHEWGLCKTKQVSKFYDVNAILQYILSILHEVDA